MWRWGAGSRFGDTLLLPILSRGSWTTGRLLVTRPFLGSAARIPLWLYLGAALGSRFGFPVGWTGPRFVGSWTRLWFTGMRTRPAVARSRIPPRSGARLASLVAARTRPAKNFLKTLYSMFWHIKKTQIIKLPCLTYILKVILTWSGIWSDSESFCGSCCESGDGYEICREQQKGEKQNYSHSLLYSTPSVVKECPYLERLPE